jgi:hypothetical protein
VGQAPLFQPIYPFQWGMPLCTPGFIIGMIAGMLASVIESFGDYHSVARIAGRGAPNAKRINHGIGMEGLGNTFAGIMGTGNGSTSYTENIGAIGITGVASRYVVQIGAVVMIVVGYLGPVGHDFPTVSDGERADVRPREQRRFTLPGARVSPGVGARGLDDEFRVGVIDRHLQPEHSRDVHYPGFAD